MKSIRFFNRLLVIVATICFPIAVMAQGNPGTDPDVPIDGGVGLLIAGGVAYGIKKARDMRKAKEQAAKDTK